MANHYTQFSELITDIPREASHWLANVLSFRVDGCSDASLKSFKENMSLNGDVELDTWPLFDYEVDYPVEGDTGDVWLKSDEHCNLDHVEWFVRELIRRYMPDCVFSLTYAETCSKPRYGEFGGGWMVVSKDKVAYGNTHNDVRQAVAMLEDNKTMIHDGEERVECQNCDWAGERKDCNPIADIMERVDAGELMPAGECPKCGALCHFQRELEISQSSDNKATLQGLTPDSDGFWITAGNASVYLKRTDEGLVVDVYPLNREMEESVASTYAFDSELAPSGD